MYSILIFLEHNFDEVYSIMYLVCQVPHHKMCRLLAKCNWNPQTTARYILLLLNWIIITYPYIRVVACFFVILFKINLRPLIWMISKTSTRFVHLFYWGSHGRSRNPLNVEEGFPSMPNVLTRHILTLSLLCNRRTALLVPGIGVFTISSPLRYRAASYLGQTTEVWKLK